MSTDVISCTETCVLNLELLPPTVYSFRVCQFLHPTRYHSTAIFVGTYAHLKLAYHLVSGHNAITTDGHAMKLVQASTLTVMG